MKPINLNLKTDDRAVDFCLENINKGFTIAVRPNGTSYVTIADTNERTVFEGFLGYAARGVYDYED